MFIEALFVIVPNKEHQNVYQPEILDKLWYIHTMKYYTVIKRQWTTDIKTVWVNLKIIMLNRQSQTQNSTNHIWNSRTGNLVVKSEQWLLWGRERSTEFPWVMEILCTLRWLHGYVHLSKLMELYTRSVCFMLYKFNFKKDIFSHQMIIFFH